LLLKKTRENNCDIKTNSEVNKISPHPNPPLTGEGIEQLFEIETKS
jgi:hypothetical protein